MKSPSRTLGFTILFMAGLAAIPVFADRPLASTVCTTGAVDIASGIYSQSTSHSNISGPALARRYAREASAYQRATQGSDRGLDIFYRVELTPQEAAVGKSVELTVTVGDAWRKFKVNVPGGVQNGTRLRLKGEGNPGKNGGRPGDLFLVVTIR